MTGLAGLIGSLLPLTVLAAGASGLIGGRYLWYFSFIVHSTTCFFLAALTANFFSLDGAVSVVSPVFFPANSWAPESVLSWMFHDSVFALAAALVVLCYHLVSKEQLEISRSSIGGLAGYLACILGAIGAGNLFLFSVFVSGALVPKIIFASLNAEKNKLIDLRDSTFLGVVALFCLFLCVLVFSPTFGGESKEWFKLEGGTTEISQGTIGFFLLLFASLILSGLFPFHGSARKSFDVSPFEKAAPLSLQSILGFILLYRFSSSIFPQELNRFGYWLMLLFSVGAAYGAANLAGATRARDRVYWLQQCALNFAAVGYFSLRPMGWHGSSVLLFFQIVSMTFSVFVLAFQERRSEKVQIRWTSDAPYFSISVITAVLCSLFLPVSVGFYGLLLVVWSLIGKGAPALILVTLSVPLLAIAGMRMMFFKLGDHAYLNVSKTPDLTFRELMAVLPLGVTLLALGLVPKILMGPIGVSASGLLTAMGIGK